ncbi:MAG: single-stranded DNA-binding protein, partial [Chloroflexi bacterium]|nr:single-stranded DNA-binding protein [Chloroflexota bacterium]
MFQTLILIGNLGKEPEMRYTPSGQPVTTLSVATNRRYSGANGQPVKETA